MEIEKICRCCLALSGPLLSIYDGGSAGGGCVADMLKEIAKLKPQPNDNMPEKACLQCISEINHCYMFKIKCENSNKTLRQLLPDAIKEPVDNVPRKVSLSSCAVQTEDKIMINSLVQTMYEEKPLLSNRAIQTMEEEKPFINHREVQTEYTIVTTIPKEKKIEKGTEDSVEEDIIIYEKIESPTRKRNMSVQIIKQFSPPMKKICYEDNNQELLPTGEESNTQHEAYILLEDSNMDSNCSQEQKLFLQSLAENRSDQDSDQHNRRYEYFDNEAEENPDTNQKCVAFHDDEEYVYNDEDLQTEEDEYQIDSSEIVRFSQASKSSSKKKKATSKPKGLYKCSHCIMTFVSFKVLRRHLANRHNIKDTEIIIEDKLTEPVDKTSTEIEEPSSSGIELSLENVPNPQLLPRDHVTSPVNEELLTQAKYFCDYCQAGFVQHKTLKYHMKHNVCMSGNFKCNECDRMFVSQENLDNHKAVHDHQHKCLDCPKVCKTIEDLSQHMIDEHNRNVRNQCNICKKVFTMKASLKDHLRIHSGEKPFLCTICGKSFRQNSNLRQHLLRHTNAKNFKCDMCPNAFVTKAELFSHTLTHTGEQPFKCDECSACFTSACSLRKHRRKHTGERPYACEICPLRFATLNVLKNHRRTHTGEKPFKCGYCEKSFTQKGDCLMHEKIHINKDFKCFCGSKTTKKSNFKHHIKTQHPNLSEKQINALIDKTKDTNNAELHITLLEDDIEDDNAGVLDEVETDFVTNEDEEKDNIVEGLNNSKTSNNEELMHIIMEDVM